MANKTPIMQKLNTVTEADEAKFHPSKKSYTVQFLITIALSLALLSGCTKIIFKAAYNNSGWLLKNELDKYLDLTWAQDDILADSLTVFLSDHRAIELPATDAFLEDIKNKVQNSPNNPITLKEVYDTTNKFVNLRNRLIRTLFNQEMNKFLSSLTIEQVNYFEKTTKAIFKARTGDDGKTIFQRTEAENQSYYLEKRKNSIVTWFGEVTPEQVRLLENFPLVDLENRRLFNADRTRLLEQLTARLRTQILIDKDSDLTRSLILEWFTNLRAQLSKEYLASSDARASKIHQLTVDLDRSLTPKQRTFFVEQIEYYQEIIRELNKNS